MTIAFDFDNTFTAAPELFREIALIAIAQGHTIVLVTARLGDDEEKAEVTALIGNLMPVVYAGNEEWKDTAAQKAGYRVDVWIDDAPQWIKPQFT